MSTAFLLHVSQIGRRATRPGVRVHSRQWRADFSSAASPSVSCARCEAWLGSHFASPRGNRCTMHPQTRCIRTLDAFLIASRIASPGNGFHRSFYVGWRTDFSIACRPLSAPRDCKSWRLHWSTPWTTTKRVITSLSMGAAALRREWAWDTRACPQPSPEKPLPWACAT